MSSQQSWAEWLLDSYASSVSPVTSDSPSRLHEASSTSDSSYTTSSAPESIPSISNSSAYGPYVRTGRGGAGNFIWQTELKARKSSSQLDLEFQPSSQRSLSERREAAARLEYINTHKAVHMRQSSAQYLSVGRGGAGNYANPYELIEARRSSSLPASMNSVKGRSPSSQSSYHPGRGGAGNYSAAADLDRRAKAESEEERDAAEQRRKRIVQEVDGLLQPPPGAWLAPGRTRSEDLVEAL